MAHSTRSSTTSDSAASGGDDRSIAGVRTRLTGDELSFPGRLHDGEPDLADRRNAAWTAKYLGKSQATLKRWRLERLHLGFWSDGRTVWYSAREVRALWQSWRVEPESR